MAGRRGGQGGTAGTLTRSTGLLSSITWLILARPRFHSQLPASGVMTQTWRVSPGLTTIVSMFSLLRRRGWRWAAAIWSTGCPSSVRSVRSPPPPPALSPRPRGSSVPSTLRLRRETSDKVIRMISFPVKNSGELQSQFWTEILQCEKYFRNISTNICRNLAYNLAQHKSRDSETYASLVDNIVVGPDLVSDTEIERRLGVDSYQYHQSRRKRESLRVAKTKLGWEFDDDRIESTSYQGSIYLFLRDIFSSLYIRWWSHCSGHGQTEDNNI